MRPHLLVKLRPGLPELALPHWSAILKDKSQAGAALHPEVDRILRRRGLPVWVTREYLPERTVWSPPEVASGLDRVYRLILQNDAAVPAELVAEIALVPVVEEVRIGQIGAVELPPMRPVQLGAGDLRGSRDAIYLDEAHRYSRGDPEITVAVLDTGICLDHPELAEVLAPGKDFVDIIDGAGQFLGDYLEADAVPDDEVGHGTHVAGIIAGKGIRMPTGVAPRCRILPVRVLAAMKRGEQRLGAGLVDNINAGVKWAVDQGAEVINMSLGVRHTGGGLPHREVINYAARKGVTVVAASGNDGTEQLYYPGAFDSVIAVGAMDETGEVSPFSTYGRQVSFIAPGENVYSSYLELDYAFANGTSHAAPFVAGTAALLKSHANAKGARLTDRQVKHILKHTSDKVDQRFKHRKAGFGRLNAADALRLLDTKLH